LVASLSKCRIYDRRSWINRDPAASFNETEEEVSALEVNKEQ
jgi:hypothetical protein